MPPTPPRILASTLPPLLAALLIGCAPSTPGSDAPVEEAAFSDDEALANEDPSRLLVYTANLENLAQATVDAGDPESCRGDWQDLLYFLADASQAPDILLVQQVSGRAQVDEKLLPKLRELLGEEYGAIVAEKSPAYWAPADCSAKHHQTNAILYRKERLTYVEGSKQTWRSAIAEGPGCATTTAARYVNVAAKLGDRWNPKGEGLREVAVGSVHWPVEDGCGVTNARATDATLTSYSGAQLWIFGGDANLPELSSPKVPGSGYRPWYERTNAGLGRDGNLGWTDPIFAACDEQTASALELDACLVDHATMRFGSRYDFLFAKYHPSYRSGPAATSGAVTVGFEEAGEADRALTGKDDAALAYSMHRAVGTYVHW